MTDNLNSGTTECVLKGIHFPARHRQSAALTHSPIRTVGLSAPEMEKEKSIPTLLLFTVP